MKVKQEKLPKIKIPKSPFTIILDCLTILCLIVSIAYIFLEWNQLPEEIPIHFNLAGEPDGWGAKSFLWVLPSIGFLLWISLSIFEKFPHLYNYFKINKDTIEKQYKNAVIMMNLLKNESTLLFSYLTWSMVQNAHGNITNLDPWILNGGIILILITLIIFSVRSFRIK